MSATTDIDTTTTTTTTTTATTMTAGEENSSSGGSLLKQTLMTVDECFVYKVPTLVTSSGYRAEQWNLANPLQTCGFQVERRNNDLYLLFTTENHTKLYALAHINSEEEDISKSVEPVMDSSRYFVTQILQQQPPSSSSSQGDTTNSSGSAGRRTAILGFGFRDREVAIDLLGNLQQFQKSIQREEQAKNMTVMTIPILAQGEKIHINLLGGSRSKKSDEKQSSQSSSSSTTTTTSTTTSGMILLKKPPPSKPYLSTEESNIHLSMGNIHLDEDHQSVASTDSDVAHGGGKSIDDDDDNNNEDDLAQEGLEQGGGGDGEVQQQEEEEDVWDDFQQAS